MVNIKIGIVEDEVIIADTIISNLLDLGYEVTEPCLSYTQALAMLSEEQPDLILLDIQLAGKKTGIDVAKHLNQHYNIPFIFLTSNSDPITIKEAKAVHPHAYLVKPFNKDDLYAAIEIALSNYNNKSTEVSSAHSHELKDSIFLKKKGRYYAVRFEDILFVKSDHVYVEIQTKNDNFLVRSKLDDFVKKLAPIKMLQVHRRYFINLAHLSSINSNNVRLGEHEVPLNKIYKAQLMKIINIG